jgi:AraC family transcriptional regulator
MEFKGIIDSSIKIIAGFNFYGDPFQSSMEWTEENEIGILWKRFMDYSYRNKGLIKISKDPQVAYEIHIYNEDTITKGFFDIFVGFETEKVEGIPLELLVRVLPPTKYAVFTIQGKAIISDWSRDIYHEWLPKSGYEGSYKYMFQYYDKRFKGLNRIEESEIDLYIPVKPKTKRG